MRIPFNKPYSTGKEFEYMKQAIANKHLSADGPFSERCSAWLEARTGSKKALLTHSATAALEMAAALAGVGPGDEVIMPSYTFVTTASAFVLRGATPVFVDIRPDTLNIDEALIEAALTPRTKAIVAVHYGGVGCAMESILAVARKHGLVVIEDAAQGLLSSAGGKPLGSFGDLAALSFHETKNVSSGEGGALLVNDPRLVERAVILRQKGTNRSAFLRGEVDKYTWVDVGSSYGMSDLLAAFLLAQMEQADDITQRRLEVWETYHKEFAALEGAGKVRRPVLPGDSRHNAHLYYLLTADLAARTALEGELRSRGIDAVFHFVPLHTSPAGKRYGRCAGPLPVSEQTSERLLRLPIWVDMPKEQVAEVISAVQGFYKP